jgi:hypothetical protein
VLFDPVGAHALFVPVARVVSDVPLGLPQPLGDLDDPAFDAAEDARRRKSPAASRSPAGTPVRTSIPCAARSTA